MIEQHLTPEGVIARDVSFAEWMEHYAEAHTEWVEGVVVKLSPVSLEHNDLDGFLYTLLKFYLEETREALILRHPFVMKITPGSSAREPDIHIVLKERESIVKHTMTAGPADIVIEIVSPESMRRDYEEKFAEYQGGGVREYWLFDPIFKKASFYRLDERGQYQPAELKDDLFRSTFLPRFRLDTRVLWQNPLPTGKQITNMVEAMVNEE